MSRKKLLIIMSIIAAVTLAFGLIVSGISKNRKAANGLDVQSLKEVFVDSLQEKDETAEDIIPSPSLTPAPMTTPAPKETQKPVRTPSPTLDLDSMPTISPVSTAVPSASPTPEAAGKTDNPSGPSITITDVSYPPEKLTINNVADLTGRISCDRGTLSEVIGKIMSGDSVIQKCVYNPNTIGFSLAGTVNADLHFASLEEGSYTYIVTVTATDGSSVSTVDIISFPFKVVSATDIASDKSSEAGSEYIAKKTSDTDNAAICWNYLIDKFNNPYAAAGIMSNIAAESSFNPDAGNSSFLSINSYGICQWSSERKTALKKYADSKGESTSSLNVQLSYMYYELETSYPSLKTYLENATSASDAAVEFCTKYEQSSSTGTRGSAAKTYLDKYAAP